MVVSTNRGGWACEEAPEVSEDGEGVTVPERSREAARPRPEMAPSHLSEPRTRIEAIIAESAASAKDRC